MQDFISKRLRAFRFSWKFSLRAGFAIFIILFFILYSLFSIVEVLAQNNVNINANINIDCTRYQYPWCQEEKGNIASLVGRFYIIALGLVGAAALGVLIYGAILWVLSGAVTAKQDAKEWISSALWGLVLLLGAYLILYTINPNLVNLRTPEIPKLKITTSSAIGPAGSGVVTRSHNEVLEFLRERTGGKITTNTPDPNQTNLAGLQPNNTILGLLELWESCGQCNIVITGGTEKGYHQTGGIFTHEAGYKLDLRPTRELNEAIYKRIDISQRTSCQIPPPPNINCYGTDGNIYRFEGDHWDICFKCHRK